VTTTLRRAVRETIVAGQRPLLLGGCGTLEIGAVAGARDALGRVGSSASTGMSTRATTARLPPVAAEPPQRLRRRVIDPFPLLGQIDNAAEATFSAVIPIGM